MKFSNVFFLALMGLFTLNSCGDDDSGSSIDITGDAWSLVSLKTDVDGDGTLDETLEDCTADDTLTFNSDGTWSRDEGATKCDEADPQTSTGTYVLNTDANTLRVTEDGLTSEGDILELSNTRMMIRDEIDFLGFIIITEATYER